jgi:O-antigen/teichoic acid export membrane protein
VNIFKFLRKWVDFLRDKINLCVHFREVDCKSSQNRGEARKRKAILSGFVGILSRFVSVVTTLITVPLTLRYLGDERFGLWMAISSLIAMLSFADLGIGNGLLNAVSSASGKDNNHELKKYISSASIVLVAIAAVIMIVFGMFYSQINWASLFHLKTASAIQEAGPAALVFAALFSLNLPIGIVQRVQMGLQMGFLSNTWQIITSIFTLFAVLLAVHLKAGLQYLVLAQAGMPVIIGLLNGVIFFSGRFKYLAPKFSFANIQSGIAIIRVGLLFFVLQIVASLMYSSDSFIIARVLGAEEVPIFSVSDKIFSLVTIVISSSLMPLWPAYSEALARGDMDWSMQVFKKSIFYSIGISSFLGLFLIFFGQKIINYWLGAPMAIPVGLIIGMGIWKVLESIGSALSMFLNGASIVGIQIKIALITVVLTILLKIQFVEKFGISGSIYATIICYTLFALIPYFLLRKRIIFMTSQKYAD